MDHGYACCIKVAPQWLINIQVHQKVLLVYGQIGDPQQQPLDGTITVSHHQDSFPPTSWPVSDSHFKCLVHLTPGPNRLRFDLTSAKLPPNSTSNPAHSSWLTIQMLPLASSPPLQLAILLGKDSPATFDAVPERIQREGNGLDTAVAKFKMAAYLWQAFTGEQMFRNRLGRRCFRFEEEWGSGTLSSRDIETKQMRNEAKVHIIRSEKTVAELRDLDVAQQYEPADRKGDLFSYALDAVNAHLKPAPGQTQYVSVLILDTHWDKKAGHNGVVRGHAALGGGDGSIQLAIFGSHALQSYPTCFEEVVPAFTDCTKTDTNYVANDLNESGSNWEAANIGIGAHMHETGHLFGCPHQESGIMLRDYVTLNRTFITREAYSTRTKSQGLRVCLPKDECAWHRLDTLRFRYHPCFRLPTDPPTNSDNSVQVWPADHGNLIVTAPSGIAWIEIHVDNGCRTHIEYEKPTGPVSGSSLPKEVLLSESDIKSRLPSQYQKRPYKLEIHSGALGEHTVEDFASFTSKVSTLKLRNGQTAFRGKKLGFSEMKGSQPLGDIVFDSSIKQTSLMTQVKVFHGFAVDGVEFIYEDSTSQLFGKRGGSSSLFSLGMSTAPLHLARS
jgi:Putative peptidase family